MLLGSQSECLMFTEKILSEIQRYNIVTDVSGEDVLPLNKPIA